MVEIARVQAQLASTVLDEEEVSNDKIFFFTQKALNFILIIGFFVPVATVIMSDKFFDEFQKKDWETKEASRVDRTFIEHMMAHNSVIIKDKNFFLKKGSVAGWQDVYRTHDGAQSCNNQR